MVILGLILNLSVVVFSITGLIFTKLNFASLLYFTVLSNIYILIICFVFSILNIATLCGKKTIIPNWLFILKYIGTVAITLTFFVYLTMLMPQILIYANSKFVFTYGNFALHVFAPVCAVLSLLLCDINFKIKKFTFLYSSILPLSYFVFIMILSLFPIKPLFSDFGLGSSKFPYFFMNYIKNGWFKLGTSVFEMGVFYWFVFLCVFVLFIGWWFLKILVKKSNLTTS